MSLCIVFLGMYIGFFFLFLLSQKKKKVQFKLVYQYPRLFKMLSWILFLFSFYLLTLKYGLSIGFISWWVFATPTIFLLIVLNNPMRAKLNK